MYTHLSISGGGVKGTAIIGALKILFDYNLLNNLKAYSGSSIGGLVCFFLNIDYTCEELCDIMLNIDFNKYRDINFSELLDNWGIDSGSELMKLITVIIKQKNVSPDITFQELFEKTNRLLVMTGSELYSNEIDYYNHIITPDMKVLDAIRITICYPVVFYHIHTTKIILNEDGTKIENKKLLVDGAMFAPYPIDYFDDVEKKIGIFIHNRHKVDKIEDGEDYVISMLNCLQERYEKFYLKKYIKDTIIVDVKGVHGMDFTVSKENKHKMYEIGMRCAEKYLEEYNISKLDEKDIKIPEEK